MGVSITNSVDSTVTNDFLSDVSKGLMAGSTSYLIDGLNSDIDVASGFEDLWYGDGTGGNITYLSSEDTMDIVSTSTDDDVGGTGATAVFLVGTDDTNTPVVEVISLDGQTPVTGAVNFRRVNQVFVATTGSGLTNAGDIHITSTSSGDDQISIIAGYSLSISGHYTVPIGKSAIIKQIEYDSVKVSGGQDPIVTFRVYIRQGTALAPWYIIHERQLDTSVQDQLVIPFPLSNVITSGADIRMTASTTENNTTARARITLLQYDA